MDLSGNKDLLDRELVAFFASRKATPHDTQLALQWAESICQTDKVVISGFHSPLEKEILNYLLERHHPVIFALGRALYKKVPPHLQTAFDEGNLLFISFRGYTRHSWNSAQQRNWGVADLADEIYFTQFDNTSSLSTLHFTLDHYENYRQYEQTGKAMIVAYSRPIAMKIYRRILELRPAWSEKLAVVMTSGNKDPEEWREIIGNDAHKKELERRFKDNESPLKVVIVVDMWLTGFDVPSLSTMYVYKPMAGHNLMQAIARVNRVFGDKQGGLVVDYVGIASALKQAMNDYTIRDRKNYGDTDISKTAYPEFQKKLEVCSDLLHGFDYSAFYGESDMARAAAIAGGVDFLQAPEREETKKLYIKEALLLRQSLSLCQSLLQREERLEAAYFEAVRTLLTRVEGKGKISFREINERINELLKQSIKSEGVINLFSDIKEEFSIFDPKFLEEIAQMKQKNFAVELLRKLIAEQIRVYQRTNTVRAEKFSEILANAMSNYLKGMLTNEEVIEELLKTARAIVSGEEESKKLNLSTEELAFYDAITKPEAVQDFYTNEQLIAITRELTDALRTNKTIDWTMKESARAGMRRIVKRLLKKYKYPPEGQEAALETIMTQCEMWSENEFK